MEFLKVNDKIFNKKTLRKGKLENGIVSKEEMIERVLGFLKEVHVHSKE